MLPGGNHRSTVAEQRETMRHILSALRGTSFKEIAAKIRALSTGRRHTPAELLQREGRDERC